MMENLTDAERAGLDTRFALSRLKTLRHKIPTVTVYPRQMFLPSGQWCTVFKFEVPLSMVPTINFGDRVGMMHGFTILGAPGAFYRNVRRGDMNEETLSESYEKRFRIRGVEQNGKKLAQPFAAVEALMGLGGYCELQYPDHKVYEEMSRMTVTERRGLILRLNATMESFRDEVLQTARVYGVLYQLSEAERLIGWAKNDAEEVAQAIWSKENGF